MGAYDVQIWLKGVVKGQPVHRDNLGDTTSNGGILFREGLSASTLQAAPVLAKVLASEQQLAQRAQQQNTPRMAPPSLGPGLGSYMPRAPRSDSNGDPQE